ncbi:hypothetical protein M422DRAFT_28731 [Sphaerobolus stellatus SS14]|nr:hypothetical protein M422DRAFT_28731 [Sphaerobolus stellatus SS14]
MEPQVDEVAAMKDQLASMKDQIDRVTTAVSQVATAVSQVATTVSQVASMVPQVDEVDMEFERFKASLKRHRMWSNNINDLLNSQVLYVTLTTAIFSAFLVDFSKGFDDDPALNIFMEIQTHLNLSNGSPMDPADKKLLDATGGIWLGALILTIIGLLICLVVKALVHLYSKNIDKTQKKCFKAYYSFKLNQMKYNSGKQDDPHRLTFITLQSGRNLLKDPSSLDMLAAYGLPGIMTLSIILFITGLILRYIPTSLRGTAVGIVCSILLAFVVVCFLITHMTSVKVALSSNED